MVTSSSSTFAELIDVFQVHLVFLCKWLSGRLPCPHDGYSEVDPREAPSNAFVQSSWEKYDEKWKRSLLHGWAQMEHYPWAKISLKL